MIGDYLSDIDNHATLGGETIASEPAKRSRNQISDQANSHDLENDEKRIKLQHCDSNKNDEIDKIAFILSKIPDDWKLALKQDIAGSYFRQMLDKIISEMNTKTIYPPLNDWFNFMNVSLSKVKVIIIGTLS